MGATRNSSVDLSLAGSSKGMNNFNSVEDVTDITSRPQKSANKKLQLNKTLNSHLSVPNLQTNSRKAVSYSPYQDDSRNLSINEVNLVTENREEIEEYITQILNEIPGSPVQQNFSKVNI